MLLRDHFGEIRLYLRADSSFAVPEFFDFLEAEGLRYAIATRPKAPLSLATLRAQISRATVE